MQIRRVKRRLIVSRVSCVLWCKCCITLPVTVCLPQTRNYSLFLSLNILIAPWERQAATRHTLCQTLLILTYSARLNTLPHKVKSTFGWRYNILDGAYIGFWLAYLNGFVGFVFAPSNSVEVFFCFEKLEVKELLFYIPRSNKYSLYSFIST